MAVLTKPKVLCVGVQGSTSACPVLLCTSYQGLAYNLHTESHLSVSSAVEGTMGAVEARMPADGRTSMVLLQP